MASAYMCDRCGRYFHKFQDGGKIQIWGFSDPENDGTDYDICNGCREDFMKFMADPVKDTTIGIPESTDAAELAVDYGTSDVRIVDECTDAGNQIVCKTCMGRGLVPIGPEIRGLMECKVCGGTGRLARK